MYNCSNFAPARLTDLDPNGTKLAPKGNKYVTFQDQINCQNVHTFNLILSFLKLVQFGSNLTLRKIAI